MPRRVAEVGEGHEDGNGVYGIIRDLIVEGKDARFVNKKGRYVVNWSRALDCFTDYKAKKNPQFKSKAVSRRKISNGLRSALLNYYKKEGAKEYKDAKKVNENDEVVERQFQMPPRLFKSMFREAGPTITEDSEEDDQEDTSSLLSSEGDDKPEVSLSTSTSDTGFDEFMDMSSHEIVEPLESSLSVAGNFLTDLGLDVIKTEGEETSVGLSDVQLPPASEMFDPSMLDSAIEEICSDGISDDISDEGIDLFGVVQDICPTSGSVKGGFQFYISLTEELPDEVKTGVAQFERVANVMVYKLNPFTLTGTVPSSQVPGEVAVTVVTDAGKKLGMTCFRYIDEMREMVRQIVKDPTLQSLWFAMWSQEHGFFGNDSNIAQVLGPIDRQGQDSSVQTKQQQSVKVLQLLVYTAAQTDAREFIEMVFSTSAGQIVFNSYKDRTPLPEDVAQANGHEELAQYLTDINTRLSKETFEDVQSCEIDWLELVKAVQKQSSQDESTKGLQQPSDIDDASDYFADVETSSCGSSDHDIVWTNMLENKAAWKCPRGSHILQEPCTDEDIFNDVHTVGTTMSENGPSNKCPLTATNSDETLKIAEESTQRLTTRPVVDKKGTPRKHEAQLDNENDKEGVTYGSFAHTFDCISKWWKKKDSGTVAMEQDKCLDEKEKELPSKSRSLFQGLFCRGSDTSEANVHSASGPHMTKPKECHKRPGRATGRSTKKKEAGLNYKGVVLTFALLTVLAGFKLKEGQILHWAVGNGYTQFSKMLLQCGVYVDVPGLLKETPLHLAAKNGFRDLVDVLVQSGGNVNARNFPMQETPLHLATRNGHRHIAQFLVQQGSQVNARNEPWQETPLHLATRNGHRHIAQFLLQRGSQVNARNVPWQETPLHLATRNGHRHIAQFLVQQGSQVNARNVPSRETPLHLASRNGHQQIAEFLIHHGSEVNARNAPWQETPLQLASKNGHQQIAEFLVKTGGLVNARKRPWKETALHRASRNGHQQIAEVLIQHGGQVDARNVPWQETPLHLAAMNRQKQIAEFLMQNGDVVNDRNIPVQETPLHQDTRNGLQQIAESLVRQEGSANNSNVPLQETSLHRAEKNVHQPAVEFLMLKRSQDDSRILPMPETPPHLVSQNGCQAIQIAVPLSHNGGQVHARKVETPFHWARKSGPRHTSQFFTQPNDISSRRNENYLPSQLVARNGQHTGLVNAKNSSLQTNSLNLASRTGRRQIAESSIGRVIEIIAKDIKRQETSLILQGSGINAQICEKDVSPHLAARNEIKRCRQKSSPELVVRRLSQVSVSSVLCHWVKKYSATSDFRPSARRKIPRLRFTRGGGLCNYLNETDQTKSPIFTERHQHASLGAKDLVDQSLVQSQMSTRKEKLLTHAFGSSSDRKTSQELSWYTTVLCVDRKCGKDGINWVLTNNFSVIIGCCVALCFVFVALSLWFFWRNKQTACFARHCSVLPFLDYTSESEVKCIRTKELIETKEGDKCVKEAADNGALGDKGRTQTISTKNSALELFDPNDDKSVRRLRMERVRKWLECNHDQDVLSSAASEVELSPTMSRFSSSTMVKELTIDETVNIEMPESADTVPSMTQSHAVTGSVQETYTAVSCMPCTDEETFNYVKHPVGTTMSENGPSNKCSLKATNSDEKLTKAEESTQRPTARPVANKKGTPSKHEAHACKQVPSMAQSHDVTGSVQGTDTAVSCIPCGHGCYRCQRCEKCSSCGNKDVLVNCSINRVAVCSKSCKSKTHYFNESDGQSYPCTECCGKDKTNIEPVPLKRKEKDSLAPAGKSVVVLKSSDVTMRNNSVFMPNTIEVAQLKKKERGQFVTNVQISSKMSQQDIRELLISLFPYLGDRRFYCASAEDDRTRLDFHGERRIWDGRLIKQKIKGNSALYIFAEEGSLRRQVSSTHSKQPTLDEILVGYGAATRVQEGVTCNSAAQSKRGSVVNTEVECAGKSGSVSNATDAHNHEDAGMSRSDYEEAINELESFLTSLFQDEMDHFKRDCVDSHLEASEEEADENKEGGSAINLVARAVDCCFEDIFEILPVYSDSLAWSSSEDSGWDRFGPREFSFAGHLLLGLDGPGKDKFLLSEESIQRLRHVTLKDPKRKSLRRRRRHVTTHKTLCRYVIATDTTASDYLDTLSRITTGTWCESGDFAKPSRYPCNLSTNVDEGLYRRWSPCQDGTSNRPSLVKTAEKADQHSRVSTKLKQIADEIGAERGSCRRVDAQVYEIRSPTPVVPTRPLIQCQVQDFYDRIV